MTQELGQKASPWSLRFTSHLPSSFALDDTVLDTFAVEIVDPISGEKDKNISQWTISLTIIVTSSSQPIELNGGTYELNEGVALIQGLNLSALIKQTGITPPSLRLSASVASPYSASSVVHIAISDKLVVQAPGERPSLPSLSLRLCEPLAPVWYADRHFPRFDVELYDPVSSVAVTAPEGVKVMVSVIDGFGRDASDKVREAIHTHQFPIIGSRASVCGLRFSAVSSKCGGYFRVCVDVTAPLSAASHIRGVMSDKIQVLSYRLYNSPKLTMEKLGPEDPLKKMPGIGNLYAKRFGMVGIKRVIDLAQLDVHAMGQEKARGLLDHLRKERGGLNLFKLADLATKAREVVQRWEDDQRNQRVEELKPPVQSSATPPQQLQQPPQQQNLRQFSVQHQEQQQVQTHHYQQQVPSHFQQTPQFHQQQQPSHHQQQHAHVQQHTQPRQYQQHQPPQQHGVQQERMVFYQPYSSSGLVDTSPPPPPNPSKQMGGLAVANLVCCPMSPGKFEMASSMRRKGGPDEVHQEERVVKRVRSFTMPESFLVE